MKTPVLNFLNCVIFFVGFLVSPILMGQSLAPGVWHAETNFKVDGFPLPTSVGEECVTTREASNAQLAISKKLEKIGCVITDWNIQDNNLEAALTCHSAEVNAKGKISGQFSDRSYHLEGQAHGFYKKILPSVASVRLDGHWLDNCTTK